MYSYRNRDLVELVDWLSVTPTVDTLTSLSASCPGAENCVALGRLIKKCTKSLNDLEIVVSDDNDSVWKSETSPSFLDAASISQNFRLFRLRLQEFHVSSIPSLVTFLSSAPSHIQTLYLNIRGLPADLSVASWITLDTILATGDNFMELKEVGIVIQQTEKGEFTWHKNVERTAVQGWSSKIHERDLLSDFDLHKLW